MEPGEDDAYSINVPLLVDVNKKPSSGDTGDTSFYRTCFNGLNALSGVGILAVPYALSSGGWLSLILLFVIATATCYTGFLIKRCMDIDSRIKTYSDIGELAFGKLGRVLVSIMINLELYTAAIALLICGGDNSHTIVPNMKFEIINGFTINETRSSLIIASLIIMPTVWLTNMRLLSYISATGVIASLVLLVSMLWAGTFDGIKFQEKGRLISWSGIPTTISLYSVCYCGHPVFPTLYSSMRNKRQFSQVLIICFLFTTLTCAAMAILGYTMFGSNVLSQITLNLPTNKISSNVAIYTTLINPLTKYALIIAPIVSSIENQFISGSNKTSFTSTLIMRTTLLITTVIVALAFPFFGYLMSLIGAFLTMTTSVILPCACFLKISGIYWRCGVELFVIFFVMLLGISVMIIGTYVSVLEIIGEYSTTGTISIP